MAESDTTNPTTDVRGLRANRREFLIHSTMAGVVAGLGLTAAACSPAPDQAEEQSEKEAEGGTSPANDDSELTARDLEGAERVMGVKYTPEQRAEVLEVIGGQRGAMDRVRDYGLENGLPPAPAFDPRLPGKQFADQENSVTTAAGNPGPLPSNEEDIAFAPVTALSHWLWTGAITSLDLTEIYLSRIETYAGKLECFVTVTADLARQQAARADAEMAAGTYRGPLHGIPFSLKDLADTAGIRTTWGAGPFRDRVPDSDAAVVKKLQEAGAVLLGKAVSGALAFGDVWFGGMTRNPWNLEEGSSGSSAGPSSSTAAGLAAFGIGTETLGSIISPANRCGLAGLRPTFGRVARSGLMALSWSLDKCGPLCRSVEDTALVLAAINGSDKGDVSSIDIGFHYDGGQALGELRIGYMPAAFEEEGVSDIDRSALEAARGLGLSLVEITLPDLPYGIMTPIIRAESAAAFDAFTRSGEVDELRLVGTRSRGTGWRTVRMLSAVDYVNMERFRRIVMAAMDEMFAGVDVIIGPNYAADMLLITNYTGHPQLAMRAGFFETPTRTIFGEVPDENGPKFSVPQTISLFGKLYGEGPMIRLARALEEALGVRDRRPPL